MTINRLLAPVAATLLVVLLFATTVHAQHGTVTYERTVALDIKIPEGFKADLVSRNSGRMGDAIAKAIDEMPKAITTRNLLMFNGSSSLMTEEEDDGSVQAGEGHEIEITELDMTMRVGMGMRLMTGSNTTSHAAATHVDLNSDTFTQTHDFLGRTFLVSGDRGTLSWKLPGDERTILGYQVLKATATMDTLSIEAWFAPEIPVPAGPDLFGGLPGLILVLRVDDDRDVYTAVEIDLEVAPIIEKPSKGRSVSKEEFDKIVADKREEHQKTRVRGNVKTVIIRQ